MKALRLLRWSGSVLSPRTRPCCFIQQHQYRDQSLLLKTLRLQSTASAPKDDSEQDPDNESHFFDPETVDKSLLESSSATETESILRALPSPPPSCAHKSSRLSALHARLMLPPRLPLETLARCLVDPSADTNAQFNNASLSVLGGDLLGLYTSEAVLCRYPRLPTEVMFAAMWAYCGPKTLAAVTREWGVEVVAAPGGEVDPGYLQCIRQEAGNAAVERTGKQFKELPKVTEDLGATRPNPEQMAQ